MRTVIRREVEVAVPAPVLWDYVTDWPRQGEWIPATRVEPVDAADQVGGRLRAWTGLGRLGFWDEMTITTWAPRPDGGGRVEVLHTGSVVRGEGEFEVLPRDDHSSRLVWTELLVVPFGRLGTTAFRVAGPAVRRMVDRTLRDLKTRAEELDA
jgi:hypothetical protein